MAESVAMCRLKPSGVMHRPGILHFNSFEHLNATLDYPICFEARLMNFECIRPFTLGVFNLLNKLFSALISFFLDKYQNSES